MSHPSDIRTSARAGSRAGFVAAAILVAFGHALRVVAARGEPWLDEMWSWGLARKAATPAGVFALAHDNNHPLNTLWMLGVGDTSTWIAYRVPALVAGALTLVLAAAIAWRRSRLESVLALALVATSFLLVTYQSEARGYAGALLAMFVGVFALERWFERPSARWAAVYGASAILGVLSHLTWVHALAGFLAWSALRLAREPITNGERARRFLALQSVPIAAVALFWWFFARDMVIGGGPARPLVDVVVSALALAFGGPEERAWGAIVAAVLAVLLALHVIAEKRAGREDWAFTLGAAVVAPALSLAVVQPDFVAPRYFLVAIAALYLALARVAATAIECGGARRVAAIVLVALVIYGNGLRLVPFLRDGRGHWFEMLAYVQQHSSAETATIGGANDYDLRLPLAFFGPHLAREPRVVLVEASAGRPEWLVLATAEADPRPDAVRYERGTTYRLERAYSYSGQSGMHAILYRRSK